MFTLHPQLDSDSLALGDFPLCRVLLINDRQYPWLALVPRVDNICEIYQLSPTDQQQLWRESTSLAEQLMRVFKGDKLNIASLGNRVPQLHIHHIVRYSHDLAWPDPVWGNRPMQPYNEPCLAEFKARFALCQLSDFSPAIQ